MVDKSVSQIPFTPNIFVSAASVKKASVLDDHHIGSYYRKLNDSIDNYHVIAKTASGVDRVTVVSWVIKYENMTIENLLSFLDSYNLHLFNPIFKKEDLFTKEIVLFTNYETNQYLQGFFDKKDSSFEILYKYPNTYVPYKEKRSFKKSLKDFLIGAPH